MPDANARIQTQPIHKSTFEPRDASGNMTSKFNGKTRRTRLAIVLSHPTQYYSPWFRWLSQRSPLEIRVFYLWDFGVKATLDPLFQKTFVWDVDLVSGYDHEFVPNVSKDPGTHRFFGLRNPSLGTRLSQWRPDALLLFGYAYWSNLQAVAWARLHRVPLLFRGDSHFLGGRKSSFAARTALRQLYAQFSAIIFVGAANRDYFRTLGVPERKLFYAPHAVNGDFYDPAREDIRNDAQKLRAKLGLDASVRVLLYAGKLIPAKQPRELLTVFIGLRAPGTALVFVGDGEEKTALLELAVSAPPGSVHFLPFANQSEMPSRYLMADIFVLPSKGLYETWGLAVNEAMQLGVPALVSDRVGCQRDLVDDNDTGWVFRADDLEHLRDRLAAALRADLQPIRERALQRISRYGYSQAAEGLVKAVDAATAGPSLRPPGP